MIVNKQLHGNEYEKLREREGNLMKEMAMMKYQALSLKVRERERERDLYREREET